MVYWKSKKLCAGGRWPPDEKEKIILGNPDIFKVLANFRDLGGFTGADGKITKTGVLLRAAQPVGLPAEEITCLIEDYSLRTLIDFRSSAETEAEPVDALPGVRYIQIDIMEKENENAASKGSHWGAENGEEMARNMANLYETLVREEFVRAQYRLFVHTVLDAPEGAVLFHCFAGKDRTGLAAAILLTMLGVNEIDIMADYMRTNERRVAANALLLQQMRASGRSEQGLEIFEVALNVREEYLQRAFDTAAELYGSFEGYIREGLQLTDGDVARLREKYLA